MKQGERKKKYFYKWVFDQGGKYYQYKGTRACLECKADSHKEIFQREKTEKVPKTSWQQHPPR